MANGRDARHLVGGRRQLCGERGGEFDMTLPRQRLKLSEHGGGIAHNFRELAIRLMSPLPSHLGPMIDLVFQSVEELIDVFAIRLGGEQADRRRASIRQQRVHEVLCGSDSQIGRIRDVLDEAAGVIIQIHLFEGVPAAEGFHFGMKLAVRHLSRIGLNRSLGTDEARQIIQELLARNVPVSDLNVAQHRIASSHDSLQDGSHRTGVCRDRA